MSEATPGTSSKPPGEPNNAMDTDFVQPPKRKRGRPRKNPIADTASIASSSDFNTFDSLTDDDPGEDYRAIKKPVRPFKTKKPPPVVVHNLNPVEIENKIKDLNINKQNITRRLTKSGTKLFVTTNEEFKLLKSHLESSQTNYYTYTLDEDKVSRYVMYGLPDHSIEVIRQFFAKAATIEPVDIRKMVIKKPLYEGHTNYLIYFKKTSRMTLQQLKLITGMFGYRIYWDTYSLHSYGKCTEG